MLNGFFFGLTDCCVNAQIISLIATIYSDSIDIRSSYALFRFLHCIGN